MARPFLPKGERRNHAITARFNDEESSLLKSIARCDHTTTSNIIRELCMQAIRAQTIDKCEPCKLSFDSKGNTTLNIHNLDDKCFKCIMKRMIRADLPRGYSVE